MKHGHITFTWLVGLFMLAAVFSASPGRAVTLQQVISRENTEFNLTTNLMAVGLDGNVYLTNWGPGKMATVISCASIPVARKRAARWSIRRPLRG